MLHFLVPLFELLRNAERPDGHDLLDHFVDDGFDLLAFGRGDPFQPDPLFFDAQVVQHALEHLEAAEHLVVALDVVAVVRMTPADEHAVGALGERVEDELRVDPARTHQADDPHVGGVLEPRHPRQVSRGVSAPVAEKCHDPWLPFISHRPALLRFR